MEYGNPQLMPGLFCYLLWILQLSHIFTLVSGGWTLWHCIQGRSISPGVRAPLLPNSSSALAAVLCVSSPLWKKIVFGEAMGLP